jgi:hypothetical protein
MHESNEYLMSVAVRHLHRDWYAILRSAEVVQHHIRLTPVSIGDKPNIRGTRISTGATTHPVQSLKKGQM